MSFPALLLAVSMFKLTDTHLKLLRHAVVLWIPGDDGAPGALVSPLLARGDGKPDDSAYADIAKRAGLPSVDTKQIDQLLAEMPEAFEQLLAHGKLAPGTYT